MGNLGRMLVVACVAFSLGGCGKTDNATGALYGVEVIRLHARHLKGETPEEKENGHEDGGDGATRPTSLRHERDLALAQFREVEERFAESERIRARADEGRKSAEQDMRRWKWRAERAERRLRELGEPLDSEPDEIPGDSSGPP